MERKLRCSYYVRLYYNYTVPPTRYFNPELYTLVINCNVVKQYIKNYYNKLLSRFTRVKMQLFWTTNRCGRIRLINQENYTWKYIYDLKIRKIPLRVYWPSFLYWSLVLSFHIRVERLQKLLPGVYEEAIRINNALTNSGRNLQPSLCWGSFFKPNNCIGGQLWFRIIWLSLVTTQNGILL